MPLQYNTPKAVAVRRTKKVRQISSGKKPRSPFLGVLMLVAKQFHLWLHSKENDLIQSFQRVESQGPFMAHRPVVGWIRSYLQTGS